MKRPKIVISWRWPDKSKRQLASKIEDLDEYHWVIKERLTGQQVQAIWVLMSRYGKEILLDTDKDGNDLTIGDIVAGNGYFGWSVEFKQFWIQHKPIPEDVIVSYVRAVKHLTNKMVSYHE